MRLGALRESFRSEVACRKRVFLGAIGSLLRPPGSSGKRLPESPTGCSLRDHHDLGACRPAGDFLRQVLQCEGRVVAVLGWGPACYALKDRDLWVSWSVCQRVERLKLIVQNRRFPLLAQKGESPNLASQALSAALRVWADHGMEHFGYRPVRTSSCAGARVRIDLKSSFR